MNKFKTTSVYFKQEELDTIKKAAKQSGLNGSAFLRSVGLERANKILVLRNQNEVCQMENLQDQINNRRFLEQQGVA